MKIMSYRTLSTQVSGLPFIISDGQLFPPQKLAIFVLVPLHRAALIRPDRHGTDYRHRGGTLLSVTGRHAATRVDRPTAWTGRRGRGRLTAGRRRAVIVRRLVIVVFVPTTCLVVVNRVNSIITSWRGRALCPSTGAHRVMRKHWSATSVESAAGALVPRGRRHARLAAAPRRRPGGRWRNVPGGGRGRGGG